MLTPMHRSLSPWRCRLILLALALFPIGWSLSAAQAEQERAVRANYKQAFQYDAKNLKQFVYSTDVSPRWIGKTDTFWYDYKTSKGTMYWRVDPTQGTKMPLFDRVQLAAQLSELTQKPHEPSQLPLTRMTVTEDGNKMRFVVGEFQYEHDLQAQKLNKLGKAPPAPAGGGQRFGGRGQRQNEQRRDDQQDQQQDQQQQQQQQDQQQQVQRGRGPQKPGARGGDYKAYSPDRKTYVFARKFNLFLAEDGKEDQAVALSTDGVEDYSFGGTTEDRKVRPQVTWSSDSKFFHIGRSDARGVKELFLVNSIATPRPTLEKYRYPMPGEEAIRKTELFVGDREYKKMARITPKWKDEGYSNIQWTKTGGELRFLRRDRLQRHVEFCTLNPATHEARCLISEGFEEANVTFLPPEYVDGSDEMIWWSERSGWGHFYLYDRDGKLKNPITSGPFRASRIISTDAKNRLLYFYANAREEGENVYYQHLYRVQFDGTGLTLLDAGNAAHVSTLSPSRKYVVDNCSRVDQAPQSVLRDATGAKIMDLEKTDLSRLLETGWRMPETFAVKAADGVTDLYGDMWKPFDFNPARKYPIIVHVYPGPQTEGVTHTFSPTNTNQQLAQLGFVVIQVGHRGGTPTRSKAYHSYGYYNLRDYGLADKKSAVEQLAARCPFIDIERVGIYGHSGGGFMSAAALLQKPYNEFFKAAVASAGNHDNNIYNNGWAERYHGLKEVTVQKSNATASTTTTNSGTNGAATDGNGAQDTQKSEGQKQGEGQEKKAGETKPDTKFEIKVPTNAELAANLKGALLLVHGEIDNNVHPANTMRLVDALIKANKRFDMLILPGKRHAFGDYQPYFHQRMWDFFADHLLGDRQAGADLYDKQK